MADRLPQITVPSWDVPVRIIPARGAIGPVKIPRPQKTLISNQRIPTTSVVRGIKPPIVNGMAPPVTSGLQPPIIDIPTPDLPQFDPPSVNGPFDPPPGVGGVGGVGGGQKDGKNGDDDTRDMPDPELPELPAVPEQPVINVPIIGEIPVPPKETVILSGTTAVATVAATLIGKEVATALLKWMKPLVKQLMLKAKKALKGDLTPYETQLLMAFESEKKLVKRLKAEQKAEKLRQASVHQAPPRRRIQMRMEKTDGNRPQP
jgi:hypothetical protein